MATSLLIMVLNVALNWLLIEGNLGAPAMGVAGAALASTVSTVVGFLVMLVLFGMQLGVPVRVHGRLRLSFREFGRMMRFGVPNGTNWFLEFAAFLLFINVIVADLGTTALAALMAVLQVNSIAFMPAFGLASAGAILCGQAIGAGRHDDVPAIVRRTAMVGSAWMLSVGLIYFLFPEPVMRLFTPRDLPEGASVAAIVVVGAPMLALSAAWQLFDALGMTLGEALRSAGDTAWCMWARLLLAWFLFLPAAYLAVSVFEGGANAAILSMVGYLAILSVALGYRFLRGRWRTIQLTEAPL
jgi:MATE family multidrug resistance protein